MIHVDVRHAIIDRHRMFPISRKSFCLNIQTSGGSMIPMKNTYTNGGIVVILMWIYTFRLVTVLLCQNKLYTIHCH